MYLKSFSINPRSLLVKIVLAAALLSLVSCQNDNRIEIPAADKFTVSAIGTPIPPGTDLTTIRLAHNGSGALWTNNSDVTMLIAVSNTITTIPPKQGFLFVLPPDTYQFYVYSAGANPKAYTEKIDDGKIRYLYLMPPPQ